MTSPLRLLLVLLLVCCSVEFGSAFSTTKHDRKRPAFKGKSAEDHPYRQEVQPSSVTAPQQPPTVAAFVNSAALYYVDEEEEELVSVGLALISCVLTMAIGFGIGYGT